MSISIVYAYSLLVPNALLMPIYGVTFRKVWIGTRFKLVLVLIGLLITASAAFFVLGIGQYGVVLHLDHSNFDTIFRWTCVSAIGGTFGWVCFNEAHWLLAFFYFKMAINMPRVIADNDNDPPRDYPVIYWTGVLLNAIFPIGWNTFYLVYFYEMFKNPPARQWVNDLFSYFSIATLTCLVISGFILLWSVIKVRTYMLDHQIEG